MKLKSDARCAVIGYGSWATTIVGVLTQNGRHVNWHVRNREVLEGVLEDGHNPKYVRDMELNTSLLTLSDDINKIVRESDLVILCTPSAYLKDYLEDLTEPLADKVVFSAIKGIIPGDYVTILEYLRNRYGVPMGQLGLISGPTHAEEVSRGRLSYLTAAGGSDENNKTFAGMLANKNLIINTSTDLLGIEYAAILKNIYAIAAGIASGLGYGDNFLAVLISRCVQEMKHFLMEAFPCERNITERAYLGDLLVTCYSQFSRNRRFGSLIGRGFTVKSAMNEMTMIAEGYFAANCIKKVNVGKGIEMPVADMVYKVLYEDARPRRAMNELSKLL